MASKLDDIIAKAFPGWALKRQHARFMLRAYEGATGNRIREMRGREGDADTSVFPAGQQMRVQARWLEENHDLANGALTVMVNNIVGPHGITVEPIPRNRRGEPIYALADEIRRLMEDAGENPEVTGSYNEASMQRAACRSWLRDGEIFAQILQGNVRRLDHNSIIPVSLQLLEAEYVPYDMIGLNDAGLINGIRKNQWGRPLTYYVHKVHPGSFNNVVANYEYKTIPADRMLHLKFAQRFEQTRGMSVFAPVVTRIHDLKEYEEAERVAARVSAALTAVIRKGSPELYTGPGQNVSGDNAREFQMAPGMVFDQLQPGESVDVVESKRPSALLSDFREAMVRAIASGMGGTYSSFARDYNGTYSAQRQELVEGFVGYRTLGQEFVSQFVRPLYRRRLLVARSLGLVRTPRELDENSLFDASFYSQSMPWIDPAKEADGWRSLVQSGFESEEAVIRSRGRKPADVQSEIQRFREWADDNDLKFSSNIADTMSQPNLPTQSDSEADEKAKEKDKEDKEDDNESGAAAGQDE